jgi:hypothetical protein
MESLRNRYTSHMLATLLFMWHQVRTLELDSTAIVLTGAEITAAVHLLWHCATCLGIHVHRAQQQQKFATGDYRQKHQQQVSVLNSN